MNKRLTISRLSIEAVSHFGVLGGGCGTLTVVYGSLLGYGLLETCTTVSMWCVIADQCHTFISGGYFHPDPFHNIHNVRGVLVRGY